MNKSITLSFLFILFYYFNIFQLSAANCTANAGGGDWNDSTTWTCDGNPGVPIPGDHVVIPDGVEVTISSSFNYDEVGDLPTNIFVFGTLKFNPPPCNGVGCAITIWLAASSQIYVDQTNGIFLGNNAIPGQTYIIIGGDVVLHANGNNGFPFGPGWLPDLGALPVELASFKGFVTERSNILEWQTESEENTMVFLVERSLDGKRDFIEIGRIDAFGNSTSLRSYELEDGSPVSLGYYRLRIVDFDGTFEYSDVIAVERSKTQIDLVEVYPIPAEEEVTILVHAESAGKAIMTLSDFMGRKIKEEKVELEAGINRYNLNWEDHETIFYYLTIYNGNERIAKKILRASTD